MEAAAKKIEFLTKHILPEKPHHLSASPDWRYRTPPDEAINSKHWEEWDNPRLQYLTLVSEADRGVLMTRPYYDMRLDPPKPVPREVNALAKPSGEKKKLSLKDYKNKKVGVASADSTPEPNVKRREFDRAPAGAEPKSTLDSRRLDGHKPRDSHQPPPKHREAIVDMRLPPKPPPGASLPPRPPSPDTRKRGYDIDGEPRLQKRPRPDPIRPIDDRPRPPRDEPHRKDRVPYHPAQDRTPQRDSKPASSSSLANGRGVLKGSTGANRQPSPVRRPRGDSLNGARPSINNNSSIRTTPSKVDASAKSSLPPLLSPLRLAIDGRDGRDGDAHDRGDRKRARDDIADRDNARSNKALKPDVPSARLDAPHSSTKRDRSPLRLPALLSPTLPPMVEAELSRQRKLSPKSTDARSKDKSSSIIARKALPEQDEEEQGSSREKEKPKSLIVTLRIPKRIRQTVKRILALPQRKEVSRPERGESSESLPFAKKRPGIVSSENIGDTIAVKRPRPPENTSSSRLPPPPQTPSKRGTTSMSRAGSGNSMDHTPGEAATATPAGPESSERPTNGTSLKYLQDKHNRLMALGRRLKHAGDTYMARVPAANGNSAPAGDSTEAKLGCVLTLESILAFAVGFSALNTSRSMSSKACDTACWNSIFPLVDYLNQQMRRHHAYHHTLIALLHWLYAVVIDELQECYLTFENPSAHISVDGLCRLWAKRSRALTQMHQANDSINVSNLRVEFAAGLSVDQVASKAMEILSLWCHDQDVDWVPELDIGFGRTYIG